MCPTMQTLKFADETIAGLFKFLYFLRNLHRRGEYDHVVFVGFHFRVPYNFVMLNVVKHLLEDVVMNRILIIISNRFFAIAQNDKKYKIAKIISIIPNLFSTLCYVGQAVYHAYRPRFVLRIGGAAV